MHIQGGAVDNYGTLTITNSTLANNRAKYQGGAIYCGSVKSKIIGSNFTNNRAQEGGAIFSNGNLILLAIYLLIILPPITKKQLIYMDTGTEFSIIININQHPFHLRP